MVYFNITINKLHSCFDVYLMHSHFKYFMDYWTFIYYIDIEDIFIIDEKQQLC